jgi:uncharacterized protein YukE
MTEYLVKIGFWLSAYDSFTVEAVSDVEAIETAKVTALEAMASRAYPENIDLDTRHEGLIAYIDRLIEGGRREAVAEDVEFDHDRAEPSPAISFRAPGYNRHKVALEAQDAVNMRALAREFVRVVDQATDESRSTSVTWHDAAVILFVNKFESLCGSAGRFSDAYDVCKARVNTTANTMTNSGQPQDPKEPS